MGKVDGDGVQAIHDGKNQILRRQGRCRSLALAGAGQRVTASRSKSPGFLRNPYWIKTPLVLTFRKTTACAGEGRASDWLDEANAAVWRTSRTWRPADRVRRVGNAGSVHEHRGGTPCGSASGRFVRHFSHGGGFGPGR